jgi:hypothetical protein
MRKDYTAREVIDAIKAELQKRVSPAPQQEPQQSSFDEMQPVEQSENGFDIF